MITMLRPIQVILVDSQVVIGEAITKLLADKEDTDFVGCFTDADQLRLVLSTTEIDVVLLDTSLPAQNSIELCKWIKHHYPQTKILFFSMQLDELVIGRAIKAGCDGYITKEADFDEIIDSIKRVVEGETVYSKSVENILLKKTKYKKNNEIPTLTEREIEVLKLLADGFSSKEIADKIFVTNKTVDFHRSNLIVKFDARNIVAATSDAIRLGIID
jgi:DNA-binding NarL/FixJ family response regulator